MALNIEPQRDNMAKNEGNWCALCMCQSLCAWITQHMLERHVLAPIMGKQSPSNFHVGGCVPHWKSLSQLDCQGINVHFIKVPWIDVDHKSNMNMGQIILNSLQGSRRQSIDLQPLYGAELSQIQTSSSNKYPNQCVLLFIIMHYNNISFQCLIFIDKSSTCCLDVLEFKQLCFSLNGYSIV